MKTSEDSPLVSVDPLARIHEAMIATLVNQRHGVDSETKIKDFSESLKSRPEVWAVGVLDANGSARGILVTTVVQERLSRPFAHDILDRRPVTELMVPSTTFPWDKNISAVADELADEVSKTANHYYLVSDAQGQFAGIFSAKDLLIHQFNAHREDLEMAVSIQQAVVPEVFHQDLAQYEIHATSCMAKGVGGDFLSVRPEGEGRWLLSVCDVSGKGVAASLVTAALGGMFASYDPQRGLASFVSRLNSFILNTFQMEKYLTGVFGDLDESTGRLSFCDMGHSYFGRIRKGRIEHFASTNPFVGFVPGLEVQVQEMTLEPGDLVYIYTDGYAEQKNIRGDEWGIEAMEALLVENANRSLAELASLAGSAVDAFRGEAPRGDDEAILLLRRTHGSPSGSL